MQLISHFLLAEFTISSKALSMGVENTPPPEHMVNFTAVRLKREQIQLVADGDVIGAGMIG